MNNVVILDCYTDEPSGYGVRPFLGTHQIHLSQALSFKNQPHRYLTIDDLRSDDSDDISIINRTKNHSGARDIIENADVIYIVMGCFVDYAYFSAKPPKSNEVYELLKDSKAEKVLFYVMASSEGISDDYKNSKLCGIVDRTEIGNTYRYILEPEGFFLAEPNYKMLDEISTEPCQIIPQLDSPIVAEIETGTGCNTPTCSFCIESKRKARVKYREPKDIIGQVKSLYDDGVRHFRLGRQPNFYHYQRQNIDKLEELLSGIRNACPDLETLHIDNANAINVMTEKGIEFTKLIAKYCTSGNIAPLGIESFDDHVREVNNIKGSAEDVINAIRVLNEYGAERDSVTGLPKLLPGINLIHGLPGETEETHKINMKYLKRILDQGWMSARLFYRPITRPTGVTFEGKDPLAEKYEECYQEIMNEYVMPMQSRVFPEGMIVKGFRELMKKGERAQLRLLTTCSIKAQIPSSEDLSPYDYFDVKVLGNVEPKLLDCELVGHRKR